MTTVFAGPSSPRRAAAPQPAAPSSATSGATSIELRATHDSVAPGRRRNWLFGAGAVGVAGAAAVAMHKLAPSAQEGASPSSRAAVAGDETTGSGGYQLTQHVRRYYETARS